MKRRFALLAVSAVLVLSLAACSARNDTGTGSVNSVNPDTTPSTVPSDQIPGNDANEGGGAGGTNDSNNGAGNGMNGNGSNSMPSTNPGNTAQDGNGTNYDNGVLDNAGDAAGDLMRDIGNGVGNVLDNMGNAARKGGNAGG